MLLSKYSFGVGDRFGLEGLAQLRAFEKANKKNVPITPVWNKSFREHKTVGTDHSSVRAEADNAVKTMKWQDPYLVDADHINLSNVDLFIDYADFFTIDVAEAIGIKASEDTIHNFIRSNSNYLGELEIPGISSSISVSEDFLQYIGEKFLYAAEKASGVFEHLNSRKGKGKFIAEVSMDEVEDPQDPAELFFILAALNFFEVKPDTIAPKFTGRFNKGVDYEGDIQKFSREFEEDLLVVDFAIREFNLPAKLKLSIHSGSDKFSIYKPVSELIRKYKAGLHIKTAGTTWLEELAGLSVSGEDGLKIAKIIYRESYNRFDELTAPYSTVIDIHPDQLPLPDEVDKWDPQRFFGTLRHNRGNPDFNAQFRQLLHVGYRIAAEMGDKFLEAVKKNQSIIGPLVTENLFENHIKPLYID